MSVFVPNRFQGKLIVVEGIDGSGKSAQLSLLSQWLRSQGYAVAFSEWNSSPLVKQTTRRGKKKEMFTPTTFRLIHATDFADRLEGYIQPLLQAGAIVCADRYAFTAFARDVVRGVASSWVRNLYRFEILRGRHGSRPQPQHRRKLSHLPGQNLGGIRDHGG